jgi:sugar lactone lactonase YvrE
MKMLIILIATGALAVGAPVPKDADIAWVAKGEFCEPETVLPLPDNTLLVSNVCGFDHLGKGFLTLLDKKGQALNWRIVDNLDSPLGMAMHESKLYLVDYNRLKIFEWPGYRLLETTDLETTVANDIAVTPDGTAYVTDSAKHQVIKVLPNGAQSVFTNKAQFKAANGAAINGTYVYIGGERLWRVDLQTNDVETIGPDWLKDIDGIELETDGTLQVTPVAGPLIRIGLDDTIEVFSGPGISSANHGYAEQLGLVLIPTGYDNTVIAIQLPDK